MRVAQFWRAPYSRPHRPDCDSRHQPTTRRVWHRYRNPALAARRHPGEFGTGAVQQLFGNQLDWEAHPYFQSIRGLQVSAHFFIERTGKVWQFVSCDQRAWHAGVSSYRGRSNCNDDAIGIELEGLEGDSFEAVQYEILGQLCVALAKAYPIQHIAGHEHIAPGRKKDPGPGFDWALLQKNVAWPPQYFPEF